MTGEPLSLPPEYTPDARKPRIGAPRPGDPGVAWSDDGTATVTLPPMPQLATEQDWRTAVENLYPGVIPDGHRLRLTSASFDPVAWSRVKQGEDALTVPAWRYRFVVEPIPAVVSVDAVAILRGLRGNSKRARKAGKTYDGPAALVISWNDTQFGKSENGGTDGTLARFQWCITAAHGRLADLDVSGRKLGELVIIIGGDILEGCEIFPHQSYSVDRDMRDQEAIAVAAILYGLDELAPLFERVTVLAVGGNHGERRIGGKKVNRTDNSDLMVVEMAAIAATRDKRLGHVKFVIARSEPIKAIEVCGHVLATTHGDAYGKAQQGAIVQKVWRWISHRAANRLPGGDADVLITHHYHHDMCKDFGSLFWRQTPALDGASMHHTDGTSEWSRPGMLTFVMTPRLRYTDELVLLPPYRNDELGINLP